MLQHPLKFANHRSQGRCLIGGYGITVVPPAQLMPLLNRHQILLVQHPYQGDLMQRQVCQEVFHGFNLFRVPWVAHIDHVQQDVGTLELFQCGSESDQEVFRQVFDKSHRVGNDNLGVARESEAPAGRIQGGKKSFFRQDMAVGEGIEKG